MIYRKRGSVARWENGTLVRVTECGVATERGELFECHPESSVDFPHVDESRVVEAARAVQAAVGDVEIERLIVIEGIAEHECIDNDEPHEGAPHPPEPALSGAEGAPSPHRGEAAVGRRRLMDGSREMRAQQWPTRHRIRWQEHTQRIHLSLVRARIRVLLDLGSFETNDIARIATILAGTDGVERDAPPRLRLAPNVTAALLSSLVGMAPPNVRLVQTAGGLDGYGSPIVETRAGENTPWPNWYRPSYRVRPLRMPLQLRLECDVTEIDRNRPVAVALLAPASVTTDGILLRVLVDDGARAFPSTVRVVRIDAVSDERTWYPYDGGSFGAEMML